MRNIAKSWAIPKFDIKDPSLVFYAPFWRPDMVANGGAIVNGTGTLSVSPLGLAVGANTVDVAGVGTFVVTMPEGGTVASGTTTVTGSTVTVLAGIATTITTTGIPGTITVTPGNIIRSKDSNNHACTVTGALWTLQGRSFDVVGDDSILTSASAAFNITTALTLECWVNPSTGYGLTAPRFIRSELADYELRCGINGIVTFKIHSVQNTTLTSAAAIPVGSPSHIVAVFDASLSSNQMDLYINLTLAQRDGAGGNDGGSTLVRLGNTEGLNRGFYGIYGEARIYNRALSALEVQQNYLATKWRYGL